MRWRSGPKTNSSVRIVAVPPGEAPLWVREKWVGLDLPLTRWESAKTWPTFGALSEPRTCLAQLWEHVRGRSDRIHGFAVEASRAVDILGRSSPEAARWWRENAAELILPARYLVFHSEVCEIVPASSETVSQSFLDEG
jgi:hypothetical protein